MLSETFFFRSDEVNFLASVQRLLECFVEYQLHFSCNLLLINKPEVVAKYIL